MSIDSVQRRTLISICKTPSSWGDHQNTLYSAFAKGPRILNIVMTFVLHPLSYYNTITEPHVRFLLSPIEGLNIDFPSHFILSLIDVYKDIATRDKFIFSMAITQLLRHFFVSYPESLHFTFMCVIDATTIKQSLVQLRLRLPRIETDAPSASTAPSSSAPFSSAGGVTLETIMA